jgi:hypothetical protein
MAERADPSAGGEREPLGSAADEAVRLADAVSRWLSGHLATGEATCQVCPLCQLLAAVRERQPEVAVHLSSAGESLLAAARAAMAAQEESWSSPSHPTVQRIDVG